MRMLDYPDMDRIAERWSELVDRFRRPALGDHVRLVGLRVSGIVVSRWPLVVRDGTGTEHTTAPFAVEPAP